MARFEISPTETKELAADNSADALFELGLIYCAGRGVPIDLIEAHKWFNLAALRGNEQAKHYRAELASEMSRAELAAAQRAARAWLAGH